MTLLLLLKTVLTNFLLLSDTLPLIVFRFKGDYVGQVMPRCWK